MAPTVPFGVLKCTSNVIILFKCLCLLRKLDKEKKPYKPYCDACKFLLCFNVLAFHRVNHSWYHNQYCK